MKTSEETFENNQDFINLFERRISNFTGAPFVVLTDSCSSAIFLSLKLVKKRTKIKKIYIPKKTYLSVPQAIVHAGFDLEFIDLEWEGSYQLGNTKIYDCAVGLKEGMYVPKTIQCLSCQQKKAIPIGKGGAILLDNKEDYFLLKRMSWDGRDSSKNYKEEDPKDVIFGYHMYMTPDSAAKGTLLLNQYKFDPSHIKSNKDYEDCSRFINAFKE